jgi:hypothetical protein
MAVRVVFRCETCKITPDALTQRALEGQLRDRTFGEYRDAQPAGWLIWTAGGALGSKRYACPAHHDELTAQLRRDYGTVRCGVFEEEPYTAIWPDGLNGFDERELAALLRGETGAPPRVAGV